MCLLRAYGGYPTLVRHLGLKDMQRFRPRSPKTLYVPAPVAGLSLGPQVVAISQKKSKVELTMSAKHLREYVNDFKDSYDPSRTLRVINSVFQVFGSDGERSDS